MKRPYHHGELIAQRKAGVLEQAAHVAAVIKDEVPPAAITFLAAQPMLVIGAADTNGDLWATMLTGNRGFITVTGPSTLQVSATPAVGDPLHVALGCPQLVGLIAIEPGTRRRVRMNGTAYPAPGGLRVELAQVYANCPKYIQKRVPTPAHTTASPSAALVSSGLTTADLETIQKTDTFFVATADLDGHADASHRGGNPGFLRAKGTHHLQWPDYAGNSMFNTLGNLETNPHAGLLLPDWASGTLLHLTGTARVDWDTAHAAPVPGAQRLVNFTVERSVRIEGASPLRWTDPEYSRFNPSPL
ncbi:pyridoxamine 5'-phosphate oxidase family protein [Nocardioides sp. 1609]|uniref:pyridoxamine 5'-phosphate oxidase family protein n=1 Tax=Nocardioides sp. 1609 TaxID=2508327 RepID=UPI00106FE304|nr:pyridoxamine 5'-phosphate oxidase family protein [Nocardioides sp. 1609]